MEEIIINKVAESGIITVNLEDMYPKANIVAFDLKPFLFMELILKEKDYRASLLQINWSEYQNKHVYITCTADAIIPMWAYMLAAAYLQPFAQTVTFGNEDRLIENVLLHEIANMNEVDYADKRVVIKGCGEVNIPVAAYVAVTAKLKPVVKSIMYGEPCSTVPIYKKK